MALPNSSTMFTDGMSLPSSSLPPYSEELDLKYDSRQPVRTFFRLLRLPWRSHAALLFLYLLKMLPVVLMPVLLSESIRLAAIPEPWAERRLVANYAVFFLVLLLNIPLHMLFVRLCSRAVRGAELRLRAALVRRLQQLSMRFHSSSESGRLQSKVLRDVEEITRLGDLWFHNVMGAGLSLAIAMGITLQQDPLVALLYVVFGSLAAFLVARFRAAMGRGNDFLRAEVEAMAQRVGDMLSMVEVTRAHGLEEVEIRSVRERLEGIRNRGSSVDRINALFGSTAFVVFNASGVLILGFVTWQVTQGRVALDKIALYSGMFQLVLTSMSQVVMLAPQLAKAFASVKSVGEVLECPDLECNEGKSIVASVAGGVDFRNVTFCYPGAMEPAVAHFSLRIEPGECVAFVGESGSGKSTLMQLAIGFLRPQAGEIFLDGRPMQSLDMRTWRRHIAMVPQHTMLFLGTVRENLTYGLPDFEDRKIWQALEAANLSEVISAMPDGLGTLVGEGGFRLSGGQRQRLAIARALIRNPQLILLDEATSALDVVTEQEVQEAIRHLIAGRTTLIVAHRFSTIREASRIIVMGHGRILESGTHEALAGMQGAFAKLQSLH